MKKYSMSSKQIIRWIFINYGLFILAFFSLGFMSNIKSVVVINFVLDVILCAVSVILNIKLFSTKYKTPIVGKIGLLSATLCFGLLKEYDIEYVHPIMEHSWGQRVVRFYDPDKHIIEVGENMKVVCKRFLDSGMTPEQVAKRMDVPMKFVNACMR